MTDCCICLDNNVAHYASENITSICKHPVCLDCYKKLIENITGEKAKCPLCRVDIYSLRVDLDEALHHINNVRYESILEVGEKYDEILFIDDDIYIINYMDSELPKESRKDLMNKFRYQNKYIKQTRNRNIRKMIKY